MFLRQSLRLCARRRIRHGNRLAMIAPTHSSSGRSKSTCLSGTVVAKPLHPHCYLNVKFSTVVPDDPPILELYGPKSSVRHEWSREELDQETHRLLSVLKTFGNEDANSEGVQVILVEFDEVFKAWSMCAAKNGIHAANRAFELLAALEQNMSRLAFEKTFLGWNVAWYNNVMHAYAVCSGGREAAEKAESILDGMMTACLKHKSMDTSLRPPEPTNRSFNIAINAWAKSGEHDSGERAEEIFTRMEHWLMECEDRSDCLGAVPNARTLSGVMDAWAQSGATGAEERVLKILMHAIDKQRAFIQAQRGGGQAIEGTVIKPNVIMHNSAIHAWVNSKRGHEGAEKAEEILRMMERLDESNELGEIDENDDDDVGLKPNTRTLSLIIDSWAECENADKTGEAAMRAQAILDNMEKLYRDGRDVKPSYVSFTSCITAWSRSERNPDAAAHAEALLGRLLSLYKETGDKDFKPTVSTGNAVISAWAKSKRRDSADRAVAVFNRLGDFCEPDTYSFNSVINAHAKKGDGLIAKKLLQQMEEACQSGNTAACPDGVTYNTVIYALSKSSRVGSAEEAEAMLRKMETLYREGRMELKPKTMTYTTVITAWGMSRQPTTAENANRILRAMIDAYKAGDTALKPDVKAFTSAINACARTNTNDPDVMRNALKIAIQTFEEMKTPEYDNPNAVTYRALMKACCNLSRDPAERSRLLQSIFQQCCQDGMVSKLVLSTLREGISRDQLARLINVEGDRKQPFEWSRNVPRRDRP